MRELGCVALLGLLLGGCDEIVPTDTGNTDGTTDSTATCGWGAVGESTVDEGYVCGGSGADPDGVASEACPDELVNGGPCGDVTAVGCCDSDGNNWFCVDDGDETLLATEVCAE